MDDIMTVEEVSDYLHICKKTVYQLVKQGSLPSTRVGNNLRFYRSEIDRMLKRFSKNMRHILVVDDAPAVCSMIKRVLEDSGHIVMISTNGADSLELMAEIKFDKIFLDLRLPDMDGIEILRRIRIINNEVPIIIITGYPDSDILEKASEYCISRVIAKPFNGTDILTAVSK
jgi:excisionase family DNA binding protein